MTTGRAIIPEIMPRVFRHSLRRPSTCSATGTKQGRQPITGRRPRYAGPPLAAPGSDVGGRLYTSGRTSWVLTCLIVCLPLCSTHPETLPPTCLRLADEEACVHDCADPTMVHSESLQVHQIQAMLAASNRLWVFGYGSLVWKTGFSYDSRQIGYIDGFVRRFWQGDTTHRGTMESPGRVATLEKDKSGNVWGVAFELVGRQQIETALEHLGMRECLLGGYDMHMVRFHPQEVNNNNSNDEDVLLDTLVFVASPENRNYLGRATIGALSDQIVSSRGNAGHNVEYVTRLAEFMRDSVPGDRGIDSHLEELDSHLRQNLLDRNIDLDELLALETNGYGYMYDAGVNQVDSGVDESGSDDAWEKSANAEDDVISDAQQEAVVHDGFFSVTSQTLGCDSDVPVQGGRQGDSGDSNGSGWVDQNANVVTVDVSTTPHDGASLHNVLLSADSKGSIDSKSNLAKRELVTVKMKAESTKKSRRHKNKPKKLKKNRNTAYKEL